MPLTMNTTEEVEKWIDYYKTGWQKAFDAWTSGWLTDDQYEARARWYRGMLDSLEADR